MERELSQAELELDVARDSLIQMGQELDLAQNNWNKAYDRYQALRDAYRSKTA